MAKSRVVLATGDEWIANLINAVMRDASVEVISCQTATDALEACPRADAVIADAALSDEPSWLATQIRALPGSASSIPLLLLAHADDSFSRSEALRAGVDFCLTKPFRADELCLQILSVIAMARRLSERARPSNSLSPRLASLRPVPAGAALSGDLAVVSLATVLSLLELERRSGTMEIQGPKQRASLTMREGSAAHATLAGSSTSIIAVLRRVLRWKSGRFEFSPDDRPAPSVPPGNHSIGALLIEAARLDDEAPSSQLVDSTHPPSYDEAELISVASQRPPPPEPEAPRSTRRPSQPPPRKAPPPAPPARKGPPPFLPPRGAAPCSRSLPRPSSSPPPPSPSKRGPRPPPPSPLAPLVPLARALLAPAAPARVLPRLASLLAPLCGAEPRRGALPTKRPS